MLNSNLEASLHACVFASARLPSGGPLFNLYLGHRPAGALTWRPLLYCPVKASMTSRPCDPDPGRSLIRNCNGALLGHLPVDTAKSGVEGQLPGNVCLSALSIALVLSRSALLRLFTPYSFDPCRLFLLSPLLLIFRPVLTPTTRPTSSAKMAAKVVLASCLLTMLVNYSASTPVPSANLNKRCNPDEETSQYCQGDSFTPPINNTNAINRNGVYLGMYPSTHIS